MQSGTSGLLLLKNELTKLVGFVDQRLRAGHFFAEVSIDLFAGVNECLLVHLIGLGAGSLDFFKKIFVLLGSKLVDEALGFFGGVFKNLTDIGGQSGPFS